MKKVKRLADGVIQESELVQCLRVELECLRNRRTIFKAMRDAWRRLVAPVNMWLFRRYVKSSLKAGKVKDMISAELGWQPVMKPSKGEVECTLVGPSTALITDSPSYFRKEDGKYKNVGG